MELRLLAARSISMLDRGDRGGAVSSESYMGTPQPTSETSDERRRKNKRTNVFRRKPMGIEEETISRMVMSQHASSDTRGVLRRVFARVRSERRARALRMSHARCVRGVVPAVMTLRRRNMA
jgi:hypothetical protein